VLKVRRADDHHGDYDGQISFAELLNWMLGRELWVWPGATPFALTPSHQLHTTVHSVMLSVAASNGSNGSKIAA
jgi:hypothetical protein